ncbi:probable WRKY transcription factor 14 [Magnolia sinica]|uniref:probable WRKY transcription factor 14 n=1 Tax=Magnolia sinica TaxID=86752 RepID=UPI00265869B4|nr:probable WRKY transcription factor 14 [Magnolia sinica]
MCSFFYRRMENDQGDLADIVRASGGGGATNNPTVDWQFPSEPVNLSSSIEETMDDFGDPFSNIRDPLLHELDLAGSVFFNGSNSSSGLVKMNVNEDENFLAQKILGDEMKRPCNIFSRMIQISPNAKMSIPPRISSTAGVASPRGIKPSPLDGNDMIKSNNSTIDNGAVQISSPRNPGIKRRKSQAKKVVCIPAPAAANSRPSGEIVPSDLWAWRKYGQKPIKGSPYPRGYYRCSSSKGCSARKQVERSRTDPNMLVITYTSEHNHPWPTQRNALAGSTRSQPMKNNATSKSSPSIHTPKATTLKEEHKENDNDNASLAGITGGPVPTLGTIKEEVGDAEKEKPIEAGQCEFDQGFHNSYRPVVPDSNQPDDFFADLGELEPDPLNLMFSQGFTGEKSDEDRENKGALDPFSLFDWGGESSFGEGRRGL